MLNSVSCSSTGEVSSSTGDITSPSSKLLSGMFPEEVIAVFLQFHVSLSDQHTNSERNSLNQGMPLKLGILFLPHDTPEDIKTAADDCVLLEVKDEMVEERVYRNAWIQDVDEKLLPKAIDYLCQNRESKMYQICLKSSHGTAHLCMEKTNASKIITYMELEMRSPWRKAPGDADWRCGGGGDVGGPVRAARVCRRWEGDESTSAEEKCQFSLPKCNQQRSSTHLKVGLLFTPHGSSEDMMSDEQQHCLHTDIGLEQLGETMLSKAIDYFRQNTKAIVYQMLWKSKHGSAYIQVEKVPMLG
ncbi:hypothetical protein EJB05_54719, partial [Eragrostis curvula]